MKILILLLIITQQFLFSQNESEIIARVGSRTVTVQEFTERMILSPYMYKGSREARELLMKDFLYSILAEKLFAEEGISAGFEEDDIIKITYKAVEKMYLRDALWRDEIASKVELKDEEIIREYRRASIVLYVNYIYSVDSVEIFNINNLLNSGIPFDSVFVKRSEFNEQKFPFEIEYGMFDKKVQEKLYSLNPGEYTEPLFTGTNWIIFRLNEFGELVLNENERNKILKEIRSQLEEDKTNEVYQEFYKKFFTGKKVETDGEIFWSLAEKISELFSAKKEKGEIRKNHVLLEPNDVYEIEKKFGIDSLNMKFISLPGQEINLKTFIRNFIFDGFYSEETELNIIAAKLNSRIKSFIENELLADEAYKRGYQNLPEVKNSLAMWKDNYLSQLYKPTIIDSSELNITNEEVKNYYEQIVEEEIKYEELNIVELLTDDLEVIENVLNQIEKGADFRTLAIKHTKRIWVKDNNGEFGFFPSIMYGDIGKIASTLEINQIYGPLKVPEGFSIFQLIDKRESEVKSIALFEEIKEDLIKDIKEGKIQKAFVKEAVRLANKYGIEINENVLLSIDVKPMDMYVYRYMGFGGRISAVPLLTPFSEWFGVWQQSKRENP